jgi:glycosyltransferase involved in cell wall biosynthesis
MKIGVDIRVLMDKQYSGVAEYSSILLRTILKQAQADNFTLFYNSSRDVRARIGHFKHPNLKVIKRSIPNKLFNYILQQFFAWPKLDRVIGGSDVFWSPHINFSSFSDEAKHVLTIHDISFLRYPEFFNWRKNFWHRSLDIQNLASQATKIVAVSENTRQDIIELLKVPENKVQTIYSGVNEIKSLPTPSEEKAFFLKHNLGKRFIFYLGTIEPRKNVAGLIYAYNLFRDQNIKLVDVQLVIAGANGWRNREIYRAWEQSPYRHDIKFLGYISNKEKELLYQKAEVFVYPSYYEGFGLPVLEAMARGLPVITSNISSLPEVAGSAAITLNPYDINDIAKALELVINNNTLKKSLIESGKKQSQLFSWEKTAQEYLELFRSLK